MYRLALFETCQIVGQLPGRLIPVSWIFFQAFHADPRKLHRDIPRQLERVDRGRVHFADLLQKLHGGFTLKRQPCCEEFVEDHPQRKDIRSRIRVLGAAPGDFGRHVRWRPQHLPGERHIALMK